VRDLEAVGLDLVLPERGLDLHLQELVADLVGVERARLLHRLRVDETARVAGRGVVRRLLPLELDLVGGQELLLPGIRQRLVPLGGPVYVLRVLLEQVVELGQVPAHRKPEHLRVHVELLHLPGDRHRVVEVGAGRDHVGIGRLDLHQQRREVGIPLRIGLLQHHLHALLLGRLHGAGRRRLGEERVLVDDGDGLEPTLGRHVDQAVQVVLGGSDHHEDVLAALLEDRGGGRERRDHDLLVLLGHVGHRLAHRRGVGPHDRVHLVLGDQLLVEPDRGGGSRLVVVDHELDLAAEDSALGVQLVDADVVALLLVRAGLGVGAGHRHGRADLDRGLRRDGQRQRGEDDAGKGYRGQTFPGRHRHVNPPRDWLGRMGHGKNRRLF
jgi:hypothetical protein